MTGPSVAIIGGGISGLIAGRVLASRGARVVILEKKKQLGGSLSINLEDEWKNDSLLRLIHGKGPFWKELQRTGKTKIPLISTSEINQRYKGGWTIAPRQITIGDRGNEQISRVWEWQRKILKDKNQRFLWMDGIKLLQNKQQIWSKGLQWILTMDTDQKILHNPISKGIKRGWKKNRVLISELGWDDIIGRFVYAAQECGAKALVNHEVERIIIEKNSAVIKINDQKDIEVNGVFLATNWKDTKNLLDNIVDFTIKPITIKAAWTAHLCKGNPALFPFMIDHENKAITMVTSFFAPKRLNENMKGFSSIETVLLNFSSKENIETRLDSHFEACIPGIEKLVIDKRDLKKTSLGIKWPLKYNFEREKLRNILLNKKIVSPHFEDDGVDFQLDKIVIQTKKCTNRLFKGR